jgi:hypothetical protein
VLYGYCIRRDSDPPPPDGTTGVDGATVRRLEAAGLAIWLSAAPADRDPAAARIRDHDAVVRKAMRTVTPLPIRFGTVFADDDAARAVLHDRAAEFGASLDRVCGKMEVGVRVVWDEDAQRGAVEAENPRPKVVDGGPFPGGRRFLEVRRRRIETDRALRSRAEELLDRIQACFVPLGAPCVRDVMPRTDVAGTLTHLVGRTEKESYRLRVEGARRSFSNLSIVMSGPFAPYSFV